MATRGPERAAPARHLALLRAINVGGRNKLPMKDLAAIFEAAGATDVRTYIQSGNVVFTAPAAKARSIPADVQREIEATFGIRPPVITRSARQLAAVLDAVPFSGKAADESRLHVAFLADKPAPARARALDPDRSPPDSFELIGREVYLSLPNGVARTKLTCDYLDSTLGTVSTMRNWRTVTKLAGMLGVEPAG